MRYDASLRLKRRGHIDVKGKGRMTTYWLDDLASGQPLPTPSDQLASAAKLADPVEPDAAVFASAQAADREQGSNGEGTTALTVEHVGEVAIDMQQVDDREL